MKLTKSFLYGAVALLVVLSFVLTACQPEKTVETEVVETSVPTTNPVVEPEKATCDVVAPADKTTVTLLGFGYPTTQFFADELKGCNQVENLSVNSKLIGWDDFVDQTNLALSGGGKAPYEIILTDNMSMASYGAQGWLTPLDDLVAKYRDQYNLDDIPPEVWDAVSYDGHIYGIPTLGNVQYFFYRKDIFEKYNLVPPKTYEEWIEVSKVLKDAPEIEYPAATVLSESTTEWHNIFHSLGGTMFDENNRPIFNGPEGVKAVEILQEMLKYMPPGADNFSNDDVMVLLQQGKIASANIWLSRAARMEDPEASRVVGLMDFAPAPAATTVGGIGAGYFAEDCAVIPANIAISPDLVFQLIMQFTDTESMVRAAKYGLPSRSSVANDPAIQAQFRYWPAAVATISSGATTYPRTAYMNQADSIIKSHLAQILAGEVDAQTGLDNAVADLTQYLTDEGYIK